MLFEGLLLGTLIILTLATPIAVIIAFKHGYMLGVKDYNITHKEAPKEMPRRRPRRPQGNSDVDKVLDKYTTILDNIENYDGTSAHQKEID